MVRLALIGTPFLAVLLSLPFLAVSGAQPVDQVIRQYAPDTTFLGETRWHGDHGTVYSPDWKVIAHLKRDGNTIREYTPSWTFVGKSVATH